MFKKFFARRRAKRRATSKAIARAILPKSKRDEIRLNVSTCVWGMPMSEWERRQEG